METIKTFQELGVSEEILKALEKKGVGLPTRVQEEAIPPLLAWKDVIAKAPTGTGKTFAFGIPMIEHIDPASDDLQGLILAPTRELAIQIADELRGLLTFYKDIRVTVLYGGQRMEPQIRSLQQHPHIVVATPGRLTDHYNRKNLRLDRIKTVILDEADRMLDMGFSDDIMKIISYMPAERQTIMFSATLPPKIRELAKTILRNPAEVNIAISKPNEAIDQSAYICYERQKLGIIRELFAEPTDSKTIIFSSSKLKVKELAHTLKRMGLDVAAMHSDLEQAQREEVMLNFKNNKVKILVATDIVARGIDIEDIGLVLNYDVPHDPEDYIHRIGRTARAAASGAAMTFVSEEEQGKFHQIEKFIERDIRKAELPESVGEGPKYAPDENRGRFGRGRGGRSGGGRSGSGRGRGGRGDRSGRNDRDRRSERPAAAEPAAAQPASPDSDHASGRGEGNRGTRDRRRHRGGRNRGRGNKPQGGEPTPQA